MRFITLALLALTACGTTAPPNVTTLIDCPQPTAEAIALPQKLPLVPQLPADPALAVGVLASVIEADRETYGNLADRHTTLVNHGTQRCHWTP